MLSALTKIVALITTSLVLTSCSSSSKGGGAHCNPQDSFCTSVSTALDKTKTCAGADLNCSAARKAILGGKDCTGFNDGDGLCLAFTQALGKNECWKNDPKCDSIKSSLAFDDKGNPKPCAPTDMDCASLRDAGFSKAAVEAFNKK